MKKSVMTATMACVVVFVLIVGYLGFTAGRVRIPKTEISKYLDQGQSEFDKGNYEAAVECYNKVLEGYPDYNVAYMYRAEARYMLGQDKEALKDSDKLISGCQKQRQSWKFFGPVIKLLERTTGENGEDQGKVMDGALSAAYGFRAGLKCDMGDYSGAMADTDNSLKYREAGLSLYMVRARIKHRMMNYKAALDDLKLAEPLLPKNEKRSDFYSLRSLVKQGLGDNAGALEDVDREIRIRPNATAYNNRADYEKCLGRYKEALKDIDMAIQMNGNIGVYYCTRGEIETKLKEYKAAVRDFDRAIELNRDETAEGREYAGTFRYYRALAEIGLGDMKSAQADLEAADAKGNTMAAAKLAEIKAR